MPSSGESKNPRLPRVAHRNRSKASGWEKDPEIEIRVRGGHGYCTHPHHTPPAELDFRPGLRYRHICINCGAEIVIRAPFRNYALSLPELAASLVAGLEEAIPLSDDREQQIRLCRLQEKSRRLLEAVGKSVEAAAKLASDEDSQADVDF